MAYGQIQYPQKLGTGPTTESIADDGCFLTADSNLLERFGEPIDPPTLNNFYIQHGTYMVGGANRNLLGWGSISAYDGTVVVTEIGESGWPRSNNAIVKFGYKSPRSGNQVTHFCLVADWTQRMILDSWDGQTKVNPYGNPVAYAIYEKHTPQVIVSPPPVAAPLITVENIPLVTKELRINTKLWDLTRRTWPDMANNPVEAKAAGFKFETNQIAHHALGGSYYMPTTGNGSQGYNVVDCQDPSAAAVPPPTPEVPAIPKTFTKNTVDGIEFTAFDGDPKVMYVSKVGGTEKWNFKGVTTWREFKSVEHLEYGQQIFIVGSALHPIPPSGAMYYMTDPDFGDFKRTGNVTNQYGFNWVDLSETKPPALPVAVPPPTPMTAQVTESPAITPAASWKETYVAFKKPVHYISTHEQLISDIDDETQPKLLLPAYITGLRSKLGLVLVYGTVTKDGIDYYRLKTVNDDKFERWYCVPKVDPMTRTPNLLVAPTEKNKPVSKATLAHDSVTLARTRVEFEVPKFLDDILPMFLRNKK